MEHTPHSGDAHPAVSQDVQNLEASPAPSRGCTLSDDVDRDNHLTFELRWLSGEFIGHFEIPATTGIERFCQDMDEGLVAGINLLDTDPDGYRHQHYTLVYGTTVLEDGQWFVDYDLPMGACITVVLETFEPRVVQPETGAA